jgi:hypothetical protein
MRYPVKQLTILCLLLSAFLYSVAATADQEWYCVANHASVGGLLEVNNDYIWAGFAISYPITNKGSSDNLGLRLIRGGNTEWGWTSKTVTNQDTVIADDNGAQVVNNSANNKCSPPSNKHTSGL